MHRTTESIPGHPQRRITTRSTPDPLRPVCSSHRRRPPCHLTHQCSWDGGLKSFSGFTIVSDEPPLASSTVGIGYSAESRGPVGRHAVARRPVVGGGDPRRTLLPGAARDRRCVACLPGAIAVRSPAASAGPVARDHRRRCSDGSLARGSPADTVRVLSVNAIAAVAYGWLYWWRGLEAAVLAHIVVSAVLLFVVPTVR